MAVERKMSYAQLEPPKEKKCLNMCSQYYKNKKAKTLTDCAEKNQSMEAMKNKQNLLAKKKKLIKTWVAVKKINCLKNKGL